MSFKIIILGSGRGSNAKAILEAEAKEQLGAISTVAILSDKEEAERKGEPVVWCCE